MVDDSREEHRMLIRMNDAPPLFSRIISSKDNEGGFLKQKIHEEPNTITLYILSKEYGMTPINRIKPRVRFNRKSYDGLSSGAPTIFPSDAVVDFIEFKYPDSKAKKTDISQLQKIFADGTYIKHLERDAVRQLVAQHDVFLMEPPVKSKTKMNSYVPKKGIPMLQFLEAINNPKKTVKIFSKFKGGRKFSKDLLEAIIPFKGLEFKFGIYSRYQRIDCVCKDKTSAYRTTGDPTTLGWVISNGDQQQLQPLTNERFTRWEHKIEPSKLPKKALEKISSEIRNARLEYLLPRILSKSKTALSLLSQERQDSLCAIDELGYNVVSELKLNSNKFADIGERKRLKAVFNTSKPYSLEKKVDDIIERHHNLAIGEKGNAVYILRNADLIISQKREEEHKGNQRVVRYPKLTPSTVLSAEDLRSSLPSSFDNCYSRDLRECGYIVKSAESGRFYNVSFGRSQKGKIEPGKVSKEELKDYMAIRYLGIDAKALHSARIYLPEGHKIVEDSIVKEMNHIFKYLKQKKVI
tara:strand:+ start:5035 stop:6603 length:1569 start_codon:yes stop_codon:yes gene_type:complete